MLSDRLEQLRPTQDESAEIVRAYVNVAIIGLRSLLDSHGELNEAHAVFNPADLEVLKGAQEILRGVKECVQLGPNR